jgi:hypothetical protein
MNRMDLTPPTPKTWFRRGGVPTGSRTGRQKLAASTRTSVAGGQPGHRNVPPVGTSLACAQRIVSPFPVVLTGEETAALLPVPKVFGRSRTCTPSLEKKARNHSRTPEFDPAGRHQRLDDAVEDALPDGRRLPLAADAGHPLAQGPQLHR